MRGEGETVGNDKEFLALLSRPHEETECCFCGREVPRSKPAIISTKTLGPVCWPCALRKDPHTCILLRELESAAAWRQERDTLQKFLQFFVEMLGQFWQESKNRAEVTDHRSTYID